MSLKETVLSLLEKHYEKTGKILSIGYIMQQVDISKKYAYKLISNFKNSPVESTNLKNFLSEKVTKNEKKNSCEVNITTTAIMNKDDAIKVGKIDLNIWEVDRFKQTTSSITVKNEHGEPEYRNNFHIKLFLKKRSDGDLYSPIKNLIDNIGDIKLNFKIDPTKKSNDEFAGEIALYDTHFGKFAWGKETMQGNWDNDIAKRVYLKGCEGGLNHITRYNPSKIFFVLGNDFMHAENISATTPMSGNHLEVDGRFPKIASMAMQTIIEAINMCRSVAPVEIKWIPGNHDQTSSFWLSLIMDAYYKNDKYITVDNTPSHKKATLWGNLLVSWIHNAAGRRQMASVNMIPQLWPELWSKSIYRELHVGHHHKKNQTKIIPIETVGGTVIRQIPALSRIDYWHADNLFMDAVPAGESLLWSKKDGVVAHYTTNINPNIK